MLTRIGGLITLFGVAMKIFVLPNLERRFWAEMDQQLIEDYKETNPDDTDQIMEGSKRSRCCVYATSGDYFIGIRRYAFSYRGLFNLFTT